MELPTLTAYSEKSIPARSGPFSHSLSHILLYSGKIWRGINFGGLANLSKGRQIKNSPIFLQLRMRIGTRTLCMCMSLASRPDPQAGHRQNLLDFYF